MDKEVERIIESGDLEAIAHAIADYGTRIGFARAELEKCQEAFDALLKASIAIKKEQNNKQNNNYEDKSVPSTLKHLGNYNDNYQKEPEEHKSVLR